MKTKCRFFRLEVEYCGHILRDGTRRAAPGKLSAIENWPKPKTVRELRGFLGLTGFYSPYVRQYAKIAAPLTDLLQDGQFAWTEEHDAAFAALRQALLDNVVLHIVQFNKPFYLRSDASNQAIGAVLEQHSSDGELRPVAFYSRKLTKAQKNWPPHETEMYAVVASLLKWQSIIGTQPITILTDHHSLQHWHTEHVATPSGPTGRRGRWHQVLSRFNLIIQYLPGKSNNVADALSRWAYPADPQQNDVTIHGSAEDERVAKELDNMVAPVAATDPSFNGTSFLFTSDWSAQYKDCPRWSQVYERIVLKHENVGSYHWNGHRLFLRERICVPNALCADVIKTIHERAHFGMEKTKALVERRFDVSNISSLTHDIVSKCSICQACKSRTGRTPGMMQNLPIPHNIFDSIAVDFVELTPVDKHSRTYDYIMVVLCRLSSYCVLIPTSKAALTSQVCAELLLSHVFAHFGFPSQIVSDNDTRFCSLFWKTVCQLCGIQHAYTTVYRPQGNGAVERTNRRVVELLRRLLSQHSTRSFTWLDLLPVVQFLLNDADGVVPVSPHMAVFGRQLAFVGDDFGLPCPRSTPNAELWCKQRRDAIETLRHDLQQARQQQKQQYDQHRSDIAFTVGTLVWVNQARTAKKLEPRWFGPCKIVATAGANAYVVETAQGVQKTFNVELLKLYTTNLNNGQRRVFNASSSSTSGAADDDDKEELLATVEHIVRHRVNSDGTVQWLVKWVGSDELTWESLDSFVDVTKQWADYNRTNKLVVDCCAH